MKKKYYVPSFIIVIVFLIYVTYISTLKDRYYKSSIILGDYEFERGNYISSGQVGAGGGYYLKYSFFYQGNKYIRSLDTALAGYYYVECEKKRNDCSHIQFWVVLSKEDPRKNMIDLTQEIQNLNVSSKLPNFDNFQ